MDEGFGEGTDIGRGSEGELGGGEGVEEGQDFSLGVVEGREEVGGGEDVGHGTDGEELDVEDELGFGGNRSPALLAVGQLIRDEETPLAADAHAFKASFPAGDDEAAALDELEGLGTVDGGIELFAVGEPAGVVDGVFLGGLSGGSSAGLDFEDAQADLVSGSAGDGRDLGGEGEHGKPEQKSGNHYESISAADEPSRYTRLMSQATNAFVEQHRERLLNELKDFIRIPSVSTLPEHQGDVARCAQFVAEALTKAGLENVEIIPTAGHPLVYADWLHAEGAPTVLCYGHYDVQPPDPLELWETPPFEPTERNGNLYARGAVDDKGQMYMHIKAIEALFAVHGKLPVNVKFLIEGEEEIGGKAIAKYVAENGAKLKADVALVSDTALYAAGIPTLCIGLRGLVYTEIEATGPARDLHSGLYGGAAPNAVFGLVELLAKLKNAEGVIQVPGLYDDVAAPADAERASWLQLPFSESEMLANEVGSTALTGEPGFSVLERVWARPTLEVHGIAGGFTGAGAKTVIPATATAKVSLRLVPHQDPDKVVAAFREAVAAATPKGIETRVKVLSQSPGLMVNPDHPAIRVAAQAFEEAMGRETVFTRSGGSIPIVGDFHHHLGIPTILMGFGLPDDGLHSPNEKFSIANYYLGIRTVALFLEQYGAGTS